MARRARSSVNPVQLLLVALVIGAVVAGAYSFMNRTTDPFAGITELSTAEYLENANALSGNVYRVEGLIDDRLDNWRASEGRLFSVSVGDGASTTLIPVWIPGSLSSQNVQRGQRFLFKVMVKETGILEAQEIVKA